MQMLLYAALPLFVGTVSVFAQGAGGAVSTDILRDLAPGGKLRAAINLGNSVLAQTDAASGQPKGVTPDLARELGRRLAVPVEFVIFDAAGKVFEAARAGCGILHLSRSTRCAPLRSSSPHPMSSLRALTWCQRITVEDDFRC